MSAFRVKIDLTHFYDDYKQFVYVLINSQLNSVKCLQKRVRDLFELPKIVFVTQECYLPPVERIDVVKEGDVLKALPKGNKRNIAVNRLNPYQKSQQERNQCAIAPLPQKRKREDSDNKLDSLISSTPKIKKLSGDVHHSKEANLLLNQEIKNTKANEIEPESLHKPNCNNSPGLDENEDDISFDKIQNTQNSKKKRPRKRKKKASGVLNQDIRKDKPLQTKIVLHENTLKQNHVHFDDSGKPVSTAEEEKPQQIIFVNFLDTQDKLKPRVIKAISDISQVKANQIISPESSNNENIKITISKNPFKETQLNESNSKSKNVDIDSVNKDISGDKKTATTTLTMQSINGNLDAQKKDENVNGSLQNVNSFKISEVLPFSKPLQGPLADGDVILFKIYHLNEKNEPSISDYICGKFEGYIQTTNLLKIFIIDGQDQITEGKFSMNLDAEQPNYLFLELDDLIDKRIFVL